MNKQIPTVPGFKRITQCSACNKNFITNQTDDVCVSLRQQATTGDGTRSEERWARLCQTCAKPIINFIDGVKDPRMETESVVKCKKGHNMQGKNLCYTCYTGT